MILQQPKCGRWDSPSLEMGLFSAMSPSFVWKNAQNWRRKDDLAFKAFIWTLGAGSWISSTGTGFLCGLQCVAVGMYVPHNGSQHKTPWSWLQEVCTALHCSGALCGAMAPFPENTAAPVQALLCALGAVLLPVLVLGWLWLIWTCLYHTPIVNPGSTEVLRNKHRVHKMFLNSLHGLNLNFFSFAQAHPSHCNVTDFHYLSGTGKQLEKKASFWLFPMPKLFSRKYQFWLTPATFQILTLALGQAAEPGV